MRKLFLILMTLIACTWSIQAQTRTYHGTILDASDNEPLIGATIMPIGGGTGAAADLDGKFTITVPTNVTKAKISYVGYETQTVDLKDNAVYHLSSNTANLDEVVVVAYGTATKESLTGSVAVVGSKEIEDRPVTTVTQALEGNAPGVQVNNSVGTPGSEPNIRIRGFNTINGVNTPLYVVDGVPASGISDLNPADIESMSVLKDAASAALYGNRGANGVILITTKRAKQSGKVDVTVSIRQGAYTLGLPFYDRMGPNQWMQTAFDAQVNGTVYSQKRAEEIAGRVPNMDYIRSSTLRQYRMGKFIDDYAFLNIYGVPNDQLFDENGKFFGGNHLPGYTDLDWWPAVSRQGYRQEYNVNAAGATDKFNVFASVSYLKENGYMLGTDFERFTGRVNANYQPTSYFKFGVNLAANQQDSEQGNITNSLNTINNPFLTMYFAPIYPYYKHDADGNIIYNAQGQPEWNDSGDYLESTNVAWELRLNKHDYSKTAIDGMIYGTAIIPYGFELTFRGQLTRSKSNYMQYLNNVIGSQQGSGMIDNNSAYSKNHTFMQTLTWNHDYGLNHVDVLLDHENYEGSSNVVYVEKMNQILPDWVLLDNFSDVAYATQALGKERTESYLGRIRYDYNQQYFGEFSIRRDGSSKFAKNNRWGTFWSVGASWIISREKFMLDVDWVNYLKLRTAYGSVGNDASADLYSAFNTYEWSTYAGVNTILPGGLGVKDLKWESTRTFDLALEGSLFNDRFNFSVGYFNKRNADLIFYYVLPLSYGMNQSGSNSSIPQNVGEMENSGVELQFGVDIIRNKEFNWRFSLDATFLKNKIIKLPGGHDLPNQGLFIGRSLYEHMQPTFVGVEQATGQSMYYIDPEGVNFRNQDGSLDRDAYLRIVELAKADNAAGNSVLIVEGEGDNAKYYTSSGYVSTQLQGTSLPTVYGSFGTNLSWKGINFGLLFTYSLGGKTYDSNYQQLMMIGPSAPGALHKDLAKSWTHAPEGVTLENNRIDPNGIPELNSQRSGYNNMSSSRFLTSSNYLSLKNVNISYDLPYKWVEALRLQGINIGFTCDDVFIITRRKGMNPTYGFAGGQAQNYMPARVFSFQLNVKF